MIKTCAEHDNSAQEVIYLLMGFPLVNSSREFVIVNLNNKNWCPLSSVKQYEPKLTFLDRYTSRPIEYEEYSLTEFAKKCYYYKNKLVVRKKEAVVRLFPRFNKLICGYNDLRNACTFFVPWRSLDDFFCHEEELIQLLQGSNLEIDDFDGCTFDVTDDDSSDEESAKKPKSRKHSGLSFLSQTKASGSDAALSENKSKFSPQYGLDVYDYNTVQELSNQVRELVLVKRTENYEYSKLSEEQMNIFKFFQKSVSNIMANKINFVKRVILQGKAGCGKSYLLHCMKQYSTECFGIDSCATLGPTGVAAKNVNGCTIHSFFRLPTRHSSFKRLVGQELHVFQEKHERLKAVFIDEYSMVGCKLLAMIDQRCREMKDCNEPFGNLMIFLIGDIYQIKGVGDKALYDNSNISNWNSLTHLGKVALNSFQKAFFLTTPQRFDDCKYSNFLDRLAVGNCTQDDFDMINSRHINRISKLDCESFSDSLKICSVNEDVKEFNNEHLRHITTPVIRINAKNNSNVVFKSCDTYANGLVNVLYLAINARVMLRKNINVNIGLVNGALGYITDILYDKSEEPPSLPRFVVVKFDNVTGFDYLEGGIPLQSIHSSWHVNGISCTRVQYPLSLSWACTVHKSQSITVAKCQIDLCEKDFELGLTYVALSRVRNLRSIILLKSLSLDHLNHVKNSRMFLERENFVLWLKSLL
ncbi:ATP-dependent DNA helicase [Frankliniella fusca]|uniref:ATP-dependent DNA helicase n=1 Tax=Frankliniella fusca TaxID=407009 RepID=A0AAE1LEZ3_9NEOP|nr:ATP-dependent DNA helicase [Frankliniella fusca]